MEKNNNRIIYALKCPISKNIHYIGKSENGIIRPKSHTNKSHSEKINEWVNDLKYIGLKPDIEILELVEDYIDINEREKYHIIKALNNKCLLLNSILIKPCMLSHKYDIFFNNTFSFIDEFKNFIKFKRKETGLTQMEFSKKYKISLRVLRKLEQGHYNVELKSIIKVLSVFGYTITIDKINKNEKSVI